MGEEYHGLSLFGGEVSYKKLASLVSQGAEMKHTKLSENFTYEDYLKEYKSSFVLPLFVVNLKGRIQIQHNVQNFNPQIGETVVSLIKNNESKNNEKVSREKVMG
jgi:hypothetical protein